MAETFGWFDAVSGTFDTPSRWFYPPEGTIYPAVLRDPNPNNRLPRAGDDVSFTRYGLDDPATRTGVAYEVTIPNATVGFLSHNEPDGNTAQPLAFNVTGTLTAARMALNGIIFRGGGRILGLAADNSLNVRVTGGTTMEVNGGGGVLILDQGSTFRANSFEGGVGWRVSDASSIVLGSARLRPGGFSFPDEVSGGSTFDVGDMEITEGYLRVSGGSQFSAGTMSLGQPLFISAGIIVKDPGTRGTIDALLAPGLGSIRVTDGAECIIKRVDASYSGLSLHALGPDARLRFQQRLLLSSGEAFALDGGIITAPEIVVQSRGRVSVGKGILGLSGAHLDCASELNIEGGQFFDGKVFVGGGGRASAHSVSIGLSGNPDFQGSLTVDAGDGGTARFDATRKILVGVGGLGSLEVLNGGRLEFAEDGGFIAVTPVTGNPSSSARGEVRVSGADSLLDLKRGSLGVGIHDTGNLTVSGGGRVLADSLDVGINADDSLTVGTGSLALITGASSMLRLVSGFRVWEGTVRVANGGFMQISSEGVRAEFTLIHPAVLELANASAEVGAGGPPPPGVLRMSRGILNGSGTIRGSVEVISQGTCRPGSEGNNVLRIEGSYLQDANGRFETEVSGPGAKDVDLIDVARSVTLNGALAVQFSGGFAPVAGDQFGFIRFAEGLTGSFSQIEVGGLAAGVAYEQRILAPGLYGLAFVSDSSSVACAAPPRIEKMDTTVPGQITFTLAVGSCGQYRLEYSMDMRTWTVLQSFTGDPAGRVSITDRRVGFFPSLYYRVVGL
ncbi:MAG: hypothetical protein ACKV19_04035 [Verrucomicrobiales bacterium]